MENNSEATEVIKLLAQELSNREIEVAILKTRLNRMQQNVGGEDVTFGTPSDAQ